MSHPIVFFEIVGPDGVRLQEFYARVFDWKMDTSKVPGYAYISTGQSEDVSGGIREEKELPPERVFYVSVPSLERTLADVVANGGTVVLPPTNVPGIVHFALFRDPAGNLTGLVQS